MKKCPYCAEEVQDEAVFCKHCKSQISKPPGLTPKIPTTVPHRKSNWFVRHKILTAILALSIIVLTSGIWGGSRNNDTVIVSNPTPVANRSTPKITQPVFDVPALVGKNVDQIRQILGTPEWGIEPTKLQLEYGVTEWEKTYAKDGVTLLITYNHTSRKVIDFFITIPTPNGSGTTTDKQSLLMAGNLADNAPTYKVEFVRVINKLSLLTGIKVIPK